MLPQHFYFTGTGWLGYIVYIPIGLAVLVTMYLLLLRKISSISVRMFSLVSIAVFLMTWPLWGALTLSYEAENLCKEQGGLHVYKTAVTDGFVGLANIKTWSKYGFTYIEWGENNKKYRYTIKNNEVNRKEIPDFTGRYFSGGGKHEKITNHFARIRDYVKDRQSGEVLGELVIITIDPSWFDRAALNLLPVEYNPWICGNEAPKGKGEYVPWEKKYVYGSSDLIKSTLKPLMAPDGETR